jgi:hypothetical protein
MNISYLIFCAFLIIFVGFLGVQFEKIVVGKNTERIFYFLYAIATLICILTFHFLPFDNLFFKILLTTIIIVGIECITGSLFEKSWDYRKWPNANFMIPFCNGYNSVFISFLIFIGVSVLYFILTFANQKLNINKQP